MAQLQDTAGLLKNFGTGTAIDLTLDDRGEAALRLPSGLKVIFAASQSAPVLVMEARPGSALHVSADTDAIAILALHRHPEIGFAALAATSDTPELIARQSVSTQELEPARLANLVDAFVRAANFAFEQYQKVQNDGAQPAGSVGDHDGDHIIMRG